MPNRDSIFDLVKTGLKISGSIFLANRPDFFRFDFWPYALPFQDSTGKNRSNLAENPATRRSEQTAHLLRVGDSGVLVRFQARLGLILANFGHFLVRFWSFWPLLGQNGHFD